MSVRTWMMVTSAVVLGLCIVSAGGAADEEKETRDAILKVADALQKGDETAAKKLAADVKADADDIMNLMLPRKANGKGGLGIGAKPGAISPDGIEKKVQALDKTALSAGEAKAEAPDLQRAGYIMWAISLAVIDKHPKDKKPMPWKNYDADFTKMAKEFTASAKKGDPQAIQAAAKKLNNACTACHNDYK